MIWESTPEIRRFTSKLMHLIPENFDHKAYIDLNPDLSLAHIDDYQKAIEHYILFGRKENRVFKYYTANKPTPSHSCEQWPSKNTNNIMVFSPLAPDYDLSSGGNRLYEILKILTKDLNQNVYFFCNNPISKKYIESLQKLNIKVYYPDIDNNIYMDIYLQDLYNNNITFDAAIFCWYDIAAQYMDIVKKIYPSTKIIVDSVDVHWIREQRGYDTGNLDISTQALSIRKNTEKNVYLSADVVFAITNEDKKHIEQELGYSTNIKILSNIHYAKNIKSKLGNDIFFLGNYAHGPNKEGALNSIKVFRTFKMSPVYKKLKHKPKLYIAGPNICNKIISQARQDKDIVITGKIDNIEDLYKKSCLCLAPLYWGAGIKGKICDSGMSGIPILTTTIGNEGINFTNRSNALIANSDEEFVQQLEYFFSLNSKDKIKLGKLGRSQLQKIVDHQAAKTTLESTLFSKHIAISIVAYKQTDKLEKCLSSILSKTKYSNYTIAITDNSNNTNIFNIIHKFKQQYPEKIDYIKNKSNEYFIIPNNKIINSKKYKHSDIVLVNDDIEIISDCWLNHLYSTAYSANTVAAVGGKTLYPNNTIAEAGAELYNDGNGRNLFRYAPNENPDSNIRRSVGYCSGCLLYMRRDAIANIGALDTSLSKMYYEDSEWQYRAHVKGLKTMYEPRCLAIHDEGSSSGTDINLGAKTYQVINKQIFMKKYKNINIEQFNSPE
jgi:GT2 family glycosyltransferase